MLATGTMVVVADGAYAVIYCNSGIEMIALVLQVEHPRRKPILFDIGQAPVRQRT